MRASELKRGMAGRGLTVLQGTRPEEFRVEILGVLENAWPRGDMILARLSGAGLERCGVAAGMSGSPVYVNGKMIGAVAYTWSYAKEPLCGIVPIHQMLEAFQPAARQDVYFARSIDWEEPLPALPRFALKAEDPWLPLRPAPEGPRRIATPLLVSCYSPEIVDALAPILERFGLAAVQSGGRGAADEEYAVTPGAAIGVQLVGGDMDISALGTVTYVDGNRFLAFGHPAFRTGAAALPVTGGYVHAVVPSQRFSFKLAGATGVIGRTLGDYAFGVGGELGKPAQTLPCEVTVRNRTRGRAETYRYALARHRNWTWFLAGWVIASSISRTEAALSEHVVAVRLEARVAGRQPVVLRDKLFSIQPAWDVMTMAWGLRYLAENPWEPVEMASVAADVELIEERRTARIVGLRLSKDAAHRGEEVTAFVRFQPFKSPQVVEREAVLKVPELAAADAHVGVIACDALTSAAVSRRLAPGRFRPTNFEQLVRILEDYPSGDELAVRVARPGAGITMDGDALPGLPRSVGEVIAGAPWTGLEPMRDDVVLRVKTPWILSGSAVLSLRVKSDEEP